MYLKYHIDNKQVVEITETEPNQEEGYDIVRSNKFSLGEEFEFTIWVNAVDEDGNLSSYTAIRNNPNAKRLLLENKQLKSEVTILKNLNAELTFQLMVKGVI